MGSGTLWGSCSCLGLSGLRGSVPAAGPGLSPSRPIQARRMPRPPQPRRPTPWLPPHSRHTGQKEDLRAKLWAGEGALAGDAVGKALLGSLRALPVSVGRVRTGGSGTALLAGSGLPGAAPVHDTDLSCFPICRWQSLSCRP